MYPFITDIETLQGYVPVSAEDDLLALITPDLTRALVRHVVPLVGRPFIDDLKAAIEGAPSQKQKDAIDYINRAVAQLAMWYYSKKGGVTVDSSGLYKPKNENRWNLSESEQVRLEETYLSDGVDALEDLLAYLEEESDSFPSYANSPKREAERSCLVPSAEIVQDIFYLLHPRLTFHAMREGLRYAERHQVAPLLQDYYSTLISGTPAPGSFDAEALSLARQAVVYLGARRALLTRGVKLTSDGLRVMMENKAQVSEHENVRIEAAVREFEKSGEEALFHLTKLLNATPPAGYTKPDLSDIAIREKSGQKSKVLFL